MSDKIYVKHVQTGEVFEFDEEGLTCQCVYDKHGEKRVFKREMLIPYEPEEAWEDAPMVAVDNGVLKVKASGILSEFLPVPSPYTRTITRDGKLVVQRRRRRGDDAARTI